MRTQALECSVINGIIEKKSASETHRQSSLSITLGQYGVSGGC